MSRKKKKPFNRLPNGFGSIKKLSGNRRKPYQALTPSKNVNGVVFPGEPLGYFEKWEEAYERLALYKANEEWKLKKKAEKLYTYAEVYQMYWRDKFELSVKQFSESSKYSARAAFKNTAILHNRIFSELTREDLQNVINEMAAPTDPKKKKYKHASLEMVKNLYRGMYSYAIGEQIVSVDVQANVIIPVADDDQKGVPFSPDELNKLYQNLDNQIIQAAVIMCFSGWRITEFLNLEINLDDMTFFGGIKTEAGKNRTVPIHPDLLPLVRRYMENPFPYNKTTFRKKWDEELEKIGILYFTRTHGKKIETLKHTSHDCRHTFSWMCDKSRIDPLAKRLMMGHRLGEDVTDNVYGHRTLDELRTEIKKIKAPEFVTNL